MSVGNINPVPAPKRTTDNAIIQTAMKETAQNPRVHNTRAIQIIIVKDSLFLIVPYKNETAPVEDPIAVMNKLIKKGCEIVIVSSNWGRNTTTPYMRTTCKNMSP